MTDTSHLPLEYEAIQRALHHGCSWHGRLLSANCCECDMIRFYREHPDYVEQLAHWTCDDCKCLNRDDEAFCFRCGAGSPVAA
jgi:hypothetical protein